MIRDELQRIDVVLRHRLLDEHRPHPPQFVADLDRQGGGHLAVEIEGQFDARPDQFAHLSGAGDEFVDPLRRLVRAPRARRAGLEGVEAPRPAQVGEPLLRRLARRASRLADAPVGVDAHAIARRAAEELVDRHPVVFPGDVPQRVIDPGEGAHEHVAAPEEGRAVDVLPVVLDSQWIFAEQVIGQLLDRRHRALRLPLQRRFPPPHDAVIGRNLDEPHPGVRKELVDLRDLHLPRLWPCQAA